VLHIASDLDQKRMSASLRAMFCDRKRVFVDLLGWDVPVIGDFEIDQFDTQSAHYLIVTDPSGTQHHGSLRLLPTTEPHILGDLFPHLCAGEVPRGPNIFEVTRLCLSPSLKAKERRHVRNQLATALVEYGQHLGITKITSVANIGWLSQIVAFGWRTMPLGLPQDSESGVIGAVEIHIEPDSLERLERAGTFARAHWSMPIEALQHAA
jgi:N-acyl-L-homoserine lactone synthetase